MQLFGLTSHSHHYSKAVQFVLAEIKQSVKKCITEEALNDLRRMCVFHPGFFISAFLATKIEIEYSQFTNLEHYSYQ